MVAAVGRGAQGDFRACRSSCGACAGRAVAVVLNGHGVGRGRGRRDRVRAAGVGGGHICSGDRPVVARQIRLVILLHLTVFEPLAAVAIDRDRVLVIRHIRALDHIVIFLRIGDAEGVAVKNNRRISADLET